MQGEGFPCTASRAPNHRHRSRESPRAARASRTGTPFRPWRSATAGGDVIDAWGEQPERVVVSEAARCVVSGKPKRRRPGRRGAAGCAGAGCPQARSRLSELFARCLSTTHAVHSRFLSSACRNPRGGPPGGGARGPGPRLPGNLTLARPVVGGSESAEPQGEGEGVVDIPSDAGHADRGASRHSRRRVDERPGSPARKPGSHVDLDTARRRIRGRAHNTAGR